MAESRFVPLVMAGGSGTRFWPLSTPALPKQYLKLLGKESLIQQTVGRLKNLVSPGNIHICSTKSQRKLLNAQLPRIKNLILEPTGRNTAPCLMLSLKAIRKNYPRDTVMGVFPADHTIQDTAHFETLVRSAITVARETNALLTLGIVPHSPHTGYGYIEKGEPKGNGFSKVLRFVEKPDLKTAQDFLKSGRFLWNAGMFFWTIGALEEAFEKYCAKDWETILKNPAEKAYSKVAAAPIDKAVMEKADNVLVAPADIGWSDIGSWKALHDLLAKNKSDNVGLSQKPLFLDAKGNLVHSSKKRVALCNVDDLIVIETKNDLLIIRNDADQKVREIAQSFDK